MDRDRLLTISLSGAIVVVLALGWVVGVSPVLAQAASADAERSALAASNQASQASIAVLKTKFAGIDKLTQELDVLNDSMPADANIPIFLRELDTLSNQNSVGLTNVLVSEATRYVPPVDTTEAATGSPGSTATPTPSPSPSPSSTTPTEPVVPAGAAGRLVLIPVKITVSGTYDDIMAFVGGLQTGPRLYLISTLAVTGTVDEPADYVGDLTGFVYALPLPLGGASLADSASPTPSPTPSPSASATPSPSASATPSASAVPSADPTPSATTKP
jgi:Tfp pilus assembly protein PilO